jgi:hypothetical protein
VRGTKGISNRQLFVSVLCGYPIMASNPRQVSGRFFCLKPEQGVIHKTKYLHNFGLDHQEFWRTFCIIKNFGELFFCVLSVFLIPRGFVVMCSSRMIHHIV